MGQEAHRGSEWPETAKWCEELYKKLPAEAMELADGGATQAMNSGLMNTKIVVKTSTTLRGLLGATCSGACQMQYNPEDCCGGPAVTATVERREVDPAHTTFDVDVCEGLRGAHRGQLGRRDRRHGGGNDAVVE